MAVSSYPPLAQNGQVLLENGAIRPIKVFSANPAASGNNAFIAAVASRKIRILGYRIQNRGAAVVTVTFNDTTAAAITGTPTLTLEAREGVVATAEPHGFEFESPSGTGVQVNLSATVTTFVGVHYVEV